VQQLFDFGLESQGFVLSAHCGNPRVLA